MSADRTIRLRVPSAEATGLIELGLASPAVPTRNAADVLTVSLNALSATASVVTLLVSADDLCEVAKRLLRRSPAESLAIDKPASLDAETQAVLDELRAIIEQSGEGAPS